MPEMLYVPHSPQGRSFKVHYETKRVCDVLIVKPTYGHCPAQLALTVEGIEHEVYAVDSTQTYEDAAAYQYVDFLKKCWDRGNGFINLEHDVAPWPGALEELWTCEKPWCRFQYPVFPPFPRWSDGIGCMKFGQEVVSRVPVDSWIDLAWWDLDGQIISAIQAEGFEVHTHRPAVAHIRRPMK